MPAKPRRGLAAEAPPAKRPKKERGARSAAQPRPASDVLDVPPDGGGQAAAAPAAVPSAVVYSSLPASSSEAILPGGATMNASSKACSIPATSLCQLRKDNISVTSRYPSSPPPAAVPSAVAHAAALPGASSDGEDEYDYLVSGFRRRAQPHTRGPYGSAAPAAPAYLDDESSLWAPTSFSDDWWSGDDDEENGGEETEVAAAHSATPREIASKLAAGASSVVPQGSACGLTCAASSVAARGDGSGLTAIASSVVPRGGAWGLICATPFFTRGDSANGLTAVTPSSTPREIANGSTCAASSAAPQESASASELAATASSIKSRESACGLRNGWTAAACAELCAQVDACWRLPTAAIPALLVRCGAILRHLSADPPSLNTARGALLDRVMGALRLGFWPSPALLALAFAAAREGYLPPVPFLLRLCDAIKAEANDCGPTLPPAALPSAALRPAALPLAALPAAALSLAAMPSAHLPPAAALRPAASPSAALSCAAPPVSCSTAATACLPPAPMPTAPMPTAAPSSAHQSPAHLPPAHPPRARDCGLALPPTVSPAGAICPAALPSADLPTAALSVAAMPSAHLPPAAALRPSASPSAALSCAAPPFSCSTAATACLPPAAMPTAAPSSAHQSPAHLPPAHPPTANDCGLALPPTASPAGALCPVALPSAALPPAAPTTASLPLLAPTTAAAGVPFPQNQRRLLSLLSLASAVLPLAAAPPLPPPGNVHAGDETRNESHLGYGIHRDSTSDLIGTAGARDETAAAGAGVVSAFLGVACRVASAGHMRREYRGGNAGCAGPSQAHQHQGVAGAAGFDLLCSGPRIEHAQTSGLNAERAVSNFGPQESRFDLGTSASAGRAAPGLARRDAAGDAGPNRGQQHQYSGGSAGVASMDMGQDGTAATPTGSPNYSPNPALAALGLACSDPATLHALCLTQALHLSEWRCLQEAAALLVAAGPTGESGEGAEQHPPLLLRLIAASSNEAPTAARGAAADGTRGEQAARGRCQPAEVGAGSAASGGGAAAAIEGVAVVKPHTSAQGRAGWIGIQAAEVGAGCATGGAAGPTAVGRSGAASAAIGDTAGGGSATSGRGAAAGTASFATVGGRGDTAGGGSFSSRLSVLCACAGCFAPGACALSGINNPGVATSPVQSLLYSTAWQVLCASAGRRPRNGKGCGVGDDCGVGGGVGCGCVLGSDVGGGLCCGFAAALSQALALQPPLPSSVPPYSSSSNPHLLGSHFTQPPVCPLWSVPHTLSAPDSLLTRLRLLFTHAASQPHPPPHLLAAVRALVRRSGAEATAGLLWQLAMSGGVGGGQPGDTGGGVQLGDTGGGLQQGDTGGGVQPGDTGGGVQLGDNGGGVQLGVALLCAGEGTRADEWLWALGGGGGGGSGRGDKGGGGGSGECGYGSDRGGGIGGDAPSLAAAPGPSSPLHLPPVLSCLIRHVWAKHLPPTLTTQTAPRAALIAHLLFALLARAALPADYIPPSQPPRASVDTTEPPSPVRASMRNAAKEAVASSHPPTPSKPSALRTSGTPSSALRLLSVLTTQIAHLLEAALSPAQRNPFPATTPTGPQPSPPSRTAMLAFCSLFTALTARHTPELLLVPAAPARRRLAAALWRSGAASLALVWLDLAAPADSRWAARLV